ncbi:MAG: hypothetical protein K2M93_05860 [Muribaculaceae bacterium]|nr:hypothetical protein [Muribaculaceae bacterium]
MKKLKFVFKDCINFDSENAVTKFEMSDVTKEDLEVYNQDLYNFDSLSLDREIHTSFPLFEEVPDVEEYPITCDLMLNADETLFSDLNLFDKPISKLSNTQQEYIKDSLERINNFTFKGMGLIDLDISSIMNSKNTKISIF